MRVRVDPGKCLTAGLCVMTEDRVFDQDEMTGTVTLRTAEPPPDAVENVRQAVLMCPSHAITIDDNGGTRAT
jgi:ferredoxin